MTSVHSAARSSPPPVSDHGEPGARLRRLHDRRRLVREELLAVAVLVLALAITLVVLGLAWIAGSPPASGSTLGGIV